MASTGDRETGKTAKRIYKVKTLKESQTACGCHDDRVAACDAKSLAKQKWIIGSVETSQGAIPSVSTSLKPSDAWGAWKARFGVNRMHYSIEPGLYAVGKPDPSSHVLVTANYKLTFDSLRKELAGLDAWILVLDTKGINVWCAAGKGTFGTQELINRIKKTKLPQIVSHRAIILPQLGAPGVSAHEVTKKSGFKVIYGPVRAEDIKAFLQAGCQADEEMRRVRFTIRDRIVLTPMELVGSLQAFLYVFGFMFLINLVASRPFGVVDFYALMGSLIAGAVLTPVLLPWIPFRAFAAKGWILGLLWALAVNLLNGFPAIPAYGILKTIAFFLILPSVSSFYAMNFTGASTYTSPSGVLKEMKVAVPAIALSVGLGVVLILISCFIRV